MSIKAMQEYTYFSKYARYNKAKHRRETWPEAVERVMGMHARKFPQLAKEIELVTEAIKQKRVLGSQRALQFGGKPIEDKNARMYNCIASYCDRIKFFQECFWLLLCGCGTGFSVQKHHIAKLPDFAADIHSKGQKTYEIPDTIEGWADALGVLLATYMPHPEFADWAGYEVVFDYSQIRAKGSILASGVGKAPGHEPLKRALEIIAGLLADRSKTLKKLRPIDAYDIVMHASDAVLSGGVRRSATLCMFSIDDDEMTKAKTGNWFIDNPQRARSNNSVLLLRNETPKEKFLEIMQSVKEFGEPGFIWADSTESLYNPCVEINLYGYDESGNSGWQACNLCEINGRKLKTKEDFRIACEAAAILGTMQAAYTDFAYLGEVTKRIVEKEALLGVSITGMMDNPELIFDAAVQREMAQYILDVNEQTAKKIGINPAARATCVKPAGTTSCILGTSSGIHPHHAKRYFRRIQGNALETPLQYFKDFNPMAVEKSVWSANGTDEIITFCVEVNNGKTKNDLSALELLQHVRLTQQNWVAAGKREGASAQPWLQHNVSNTINVRPDEWDDVAEFIFENRNFFAGISLLPQSGDLDYPQAPFTTVYTPKEIVQMYGDGSLMASGLIVHGLRAFNDNLWKACDTALGFGEPVADDDTEKKEFLRRAKQFAERYFGGDVRKMTYALKCVHNWKTWLDLNREYKEVDYSYCYESQDNTKPQESIACSGTKSCDFV